MQWLGNLIEYLPTNDNHLETGAINQKLEDGYQSRERLIYNMHQSEQEFLLRSLW